MPEAAVANQQNAEASIVDETAQIEGDPSSAIAEEGGGTTAQHNLPTSTPIVTELPAASNDVGQPAAAAPQSTERAPGQSTEPAPVPQTVAPVQGVAIAGAPVTPTSGGAVGRPVVTPPPTATTASPQQTPRRAPSPIRFPVEGALKPTSATPQAAAQPGAEDAAGSAVTAGAASTPAPATRSQEETMALLKRKLAEAQAELQPIQTVQGGGPSTIPQGGSSPGAVVSGPAGECYECGRLHGDW